MSNLLDSISSTCLISGWFNDTIGGYTCTRFCDKPTNYSIFMEDDWDGTLPVPYSTTIKSESFIIFI
jgi:hypothetical protein